MLLDLEGQIVLAGKPISAVSQTLQTAGMIQPSVPSSTPDAPLPCLTYWQVKVARLHQRVQEVQILILEDMQDLREPLDALSNEREILSPQEAMQLEMAKVAYEQAIQRCNLALANILEPFLETQERPEQNKYSYQSKSL